MKLAEKDKKALLLAGIAVILYTAFQFAVLPLWDDLQERRDNLPVAERKLDKYRAVARNAELRRTEASSADARLQEAERRLLTSETTALASAELQQLAKQLTTAESIDIRSNNFLPAKPVGGQYMQVPLGLQFQCRLDQLVNFLNDVSGHQKRLAVSKLFIQALGGKDKQLSVTMELAGFMRAEAAKTGGSEQNAQRNN
jgi:type II secretion system (T2SS) protein M